MRVFGSLADVKRGEFADGSAIAIGKFDGVHLGHAALLARVKEVAQAGEEQSVVFTFENNPLSLLRPEDCPPALMSRRQRLLALESAGIDACLMVPFDADLAEMPAEQFVTSVLVEKLNAKHVCLGADFTFGRGGEGNAKLLADMGSELGFITEVIGDVEDDELGRVSSSRIRNAIAEGDVRTAGRMLGRPVSVRGAVVRGDARGRELGFPTANLSADFEGLRPADGVYAGWVLRGEVRHMAAISVGANVTFDPAGEARIEAFVLDFSGDLYGQVLEVQFEDRLRGMSAFDSVDALVAQMQQDVIETRRLLAVG